MSKVRIYQGKVEDWIDQIPDNSMDAAAFDPPYGLGKQPSKKVLAQIIMGWLTGQAVEVGGAGFKNRKWDNFVPSPQTYEKIYRKLKPGAYAVVFAGDRTQQLMGLSLMLAGFEICTTLPWLYSGGNPLKSMDMSKAIDRKLGKFDERPVKGTKRTNVGLQGGNYGTKSATGNVAVTGSATPEAEAWEGYGTDLMPFYEPWILVQKPLDGSFAENALKHGVGGLYNGSGREDGMTGNVIIDQVIANDLGTRARYYQLAPFTVDDLYHSKARRAERDAGCETLPVKKFARTNPGGMDKEPRYAPIDVKNDHDCVKPLSLVKFLAELVLPPAREGEPRRVLVPYSGSGSEIIGCLLAGWDEAIGIELDEKPLMEPDPDRPGKERPVKDADGETVMVDAGHCDVAEARIRHWTREELGAEASVEVVRRAAEAKPAGPAAQMSLFDVIAQ